MSSYRLADGGSVDIMVTNQPGWSTITSHDGSSSAATSYETVPLGDSLLGPAAAALTETRNASPSGLIVTESGLTVELLSDAAAYDPDLIRRLMRDAPFIEVQSTEEPRSSPPSTTVLVPATTAPSSDEAQSAGPQGSIGGNGSGIAGTLVSIDVRRLADVDRATFSFSEDVPPWRVSGGDSPVTGECGPGHYVGGPGYLSITLGTPGGENMNWPEEWWMTQVWAPADDSVASPVQGACASPGDAAYFFIPLNAPVGFTVTENLDDHTLTIDIPRT